MKPAEGGLRWGWAGGTKSNKPLLRPGRCVHLVRKYRALPSRHKSVHRIRRHIHKRAGGDCDRGVADAHRALPSANQSASTMPGVRVFGDCDARITV